MYGSGLALNYQTGMVRSIDIRMVIIGMSVHFQTVATIEY